MSWTVRALLQAAREHLERRGVEEPRLDAELLLARALDCDRLALYMRHDMPVDDEERARYRELLKRRAAREPLAHILGEREFYGRPFVVDRRVLVPRPETELLIEEALKWLGARREGVEILDLGTGSGCIALTMAAELGPEVRVRAVDRSAEALEVARGNARRLGLEGQVSFHEGDLFAPIAADASFDLILSNPPYIGREEEATLAPEVRDHEPHLALFSETGPRAFHHRIVREGLPRLRPGGAFFLEFGAGEGAALAAEIGALKPGFRCEVKHDLSGHDRLLLLGDG